MPEDAWAAGWLLLKGGYSKGGCAWVGGLVFVEVQRRFTLILTQPSCCPLSPAAHSATPRCVTLCDRCDAAAA